MGTQFGDWNFSTASPNINWIERVKSKFADDGADRPCAFSNDGVVVVYRGTEPEIAGAFDKIPNGSVVFWDGRLDNGPELVAELGGRLRSSCSDLEIVTAAFERWRTDAFRRILGDWSLAAWTPAERSLVLAKDPIGTRPLFYCVTSQALKWSSALEWLVEDTGSTLELNPEYLAGWLSFFPAAELTPYEAIHSVPPASFVRFTLANQTVHKYWDFTPEKEIRYRNDAEYDEQFRALLAQSVRRRLRAKGPVLAELSGGMDSSSIVCMADTLASQDKFATPRLDTISYFDDSEPNWNERPYFTKVEEKRGRAGFHIALDAAQDLDALFSIEECAATPAECARHSLRNQRIDELVKSGGYVAILSGTGGDEFTGGVPTPQPELANLLAAAQFFTFSRQVMAWAISQRRPVSHLLFDTVTSFAPPLWTKAADRRRPVAWLVPKFVDRHRDALSGYNRRLHLFGPRPSFQENLSTLGVVRRQMACSHSTSRIAFDKRYPYLDRDLLEFLFAVPRERLIQPGRRRALMRRALVGIVPDEILNRKRKAYVVRAPRAAIASRWDTVATLATNMVAESLGIVSSKVFQQALQDVRTGNEVAVQGVLRTLVLERWLRNLVGYGVLSDLVRSPRTSTVATVGRLPFPQPE